MSSGPYRLLRHPNYLAVVVEGAALPLVHTAWATALGFTVLNAALLTVRIRVEPGEPTRVVEVSLEVTGAVTEVTVTPGTGGVVPKSLRSNGTEHKCEGAGHELAVRIVARLSHKSLRGRSCI